MQLEHKYIQSCETRQTNNLIPRLFPLRRGKSLGTRLTNEHAITRQQDTCGDWLSSFPLLGWRIGFGRVLLDIVEWNTTSRKGFLLKYLNHKQSKDQFIKCTIDVGETFSPYHICFWKNCGMMTNPNLAGFGCALVEVYEWNTTSRKGFLLEYLNHTQSKD